MPAFTLAFDPSPIDRAATRMGSRLPLANARALNRTATTVRAFLSRGIATDMGMPISTVKGLLGITKATKDRQQVQIAVSGKRRPLIEFKAKGPYPSRGKGRGVTAIIQGARKSYPNAFIAQMRSGHLGVFQRTGRHRLPIYELRGVSLPHVFNKLTPEAQAVATREYVKNLAHETKFLLRQLAS